MYMSLSTPDANCFLQQLINCLYLRFSLHDMILGLRLNTDKTEFIIMGHRQRERIKPVFPIPLRTQYIMYALSMRNLEGICNNNFNFRERISQICRTCYCIRDLQHISRCLPISLIKKLL